VVCQGSGHWIFIRCYCVGICIYDRYDWDSGKVMYKSKWNGNKGSIIHADGMLCCYDENTGDALMAYDIKSK